MRAEKPRGREADVRWVSADMARARKEEQQEYDREEEQQGYGEAGEVATAFPPGRPDVHIRWDPRAEGGQGAGV